MNVDNESTLELMPWHEAQWEKLLGLSIDQRLPHALLVTGPKFVGKNEFVSLFAAKLLCRETEGMPCGQCNQCLLVKAGTHADLLYIGLEDSKQIKVEQIRRLIEWANQTAQQGGKQVCIINPADKMNVQASNALLKSLEEPTANTIIMLVTDQRSTLLPTVRSRCHHIELRQPSTELATQWLARRMDAKANIGLLLEIADGSPRRVQIEIDEDFLSIRQTVASVLVPLVRGETSPLRTAAMLVKEDPSKVLEILYHLIADSIKFSLAADNYEIKNKDVEIILIEFSAAVDITNRYRLLDRVLEARRVLSGTSNPNTQMLLEWVLQIPRAST